MMKSLTDTDKKYNTIIIYLFRITVFRLLTSIVQSIKKFNTSLKTFVDLNFIYSII